MNEPIFIDDLVLKLSFLFREVREKNLLSLDQLSDILLHNYGLKVSGNLLGKIERSESKIQIEVVLALLHYYDLRLSDMDTLFSNDYHPLEKEIYRLTKVNPDLRYILDNCVQNSLNFEFINHIRNVIKSSLPLIQTEKNHRKKTLKAASPKKKK